MSKVGQFLNKHPKVDGYTLICVLEEISRRVGASVDTLLAAALVDRKAANYLVQTVARFEKAATNVG
jgi:hypothetical protein